MVGLRKKTATFKNPELEGKRVRRKRQGGMGVSPVLTLISRWDRIIDSPLSTTFCGRYQNV